MEPRYDLTVKFDGPRIICSKDTAKLTLENVLSIKFAKGDSRPLIWMDIAQILCPDGVTNVDIRTLVPFCLDGGYD